MTRAQHEAQAMAQGREGAARTVACAALHQFAFTAAVALACAAFCSPAKSDPAPRQQVMTLAAAHELAREGAVEAANLPVIHYVDPAVCTSLELDRQTNRTTMRPCPKEGLALRLDTDAREDLAILAEPGLR